MLLHDRLDAIALSARLLKRKLADLQHDIQWTSFTAALADAQDPALQSKAYNSLRAGLQIHLHNAGHAAHDFQILADLLLRITTPTTNQSTPRDELHHPPGPHPG